MSILEVQSTERRALTVKEVADRLGISVRKVWRMISVGDLSSFKIGARGTRILNTTLEEFMDRLASK